MSEFALAILVSAITGIKKSKERWQREAMETSKFPKVRYIA